jgi:HK97 family phage major capsid protein
MLTVLREIGETKSADAVDHAIKAMTEVVTYTAGSGTAGGFFVPPQFLQEQFAYALSPHNALRRALGPGGVIPVVGHDIRLPRESSRAGASQQSEAGTLSSADATLSQQSITIEKQYAMRRWSSELGADSDPAFSVFLNKSVLRDLEIQQDIQWLRGTGSSPQIYGLVNYSGLTTSSAAVVAATNGASLTFDDVMDAGYDLDAVGANADFAIGHPRNINVLRKKKDTNGRYLMSFDGTPRGFGMANNPGGPDAILADFLPFYKTTNLVITQTVGSSTDCTTIIVGDSSQVFILERQGVELMLSPHVYFTTDELAVRATARSAVAILQPTAVTLLTGVRA